MNDPECLNCEHFTGDHGWSGCTHDECECRLDYETVCADQQRRETP